MAGRIRDQDIEEVRRKAGLIEIASEYMQVRKAGSARFKALCPFHQEKTPSFSLEAGRGLYYCFGCNKGGDVISLVMELESLTFVEAVERLAEKVGVRLTYEQLSPKERQAAGKKQRLIAAHREAVAFYHDLLMASAEAKPAREYLKGRGLSKETVAAFSLGWAPSRWDELCRHLAKKRFAEDELIEAGLALRSERGSLIDRFRGRVMFPTFDVANEPVAFGGRVLDDSTPKYLNTADTPIFHKGRVLYGLNWAKKTVATAGRVIVVEGYTDVIALHQAGITEVVASNGTALTADHFSLLGRFAPRAVLAFDSDRAGNAAAERAFDAALSSGLDARVLILPSGDDPADLVTKRGGEAFRELTKSAVPIVEYRLRREIERFDLSDSEGRTRAVRAGIPILVRIRDEVMRRDYTSRLAEWTKLDASVVFLEVGRATGDPTARAAPNIRRTSAQVRLERDLLKLALQYPSSIEVHLDGVDPDMLSVPAHRAIWREVAAGGDASSIVERLDEEGRGLVAKLVNDPIEYDLDAEGLPPQPYVDDAVNRLKLFALGRLVDEKKDQLQKLNPIENEEEYRKRYAELIALEGERRRIADGFEEGME
jgi:DNA primase